MELLFKKYFWALNIVVAVICAVLAAKAVNRYVEGKALVGLSVPQSPPKGAEANVDTPTAKCDKDSEKMVERNIFCRECEPPQPVEPVVTDDEPVASGPVPTSLPLVLVATTVALNDRYSAATVTNTESNKAGLFRVEDVIPDAGEVVKITALYVDFTNSSSKRVERISLLKDDAAKRPATPKPRTPAARPARSPSTGFQAELDQGIKKTGDNKYEVSRSLVDKVLTNPAIIARAARIVPSIKDGKANGFKLYAIRPNSVYAKLGIKNGDTLRAVNGFDITSPDKALEVYTKVKSASNLSIQVSRRGKEETLNYVIK